MATMRDYEILETIQKVKINAKSEHKNVSKELSGGKTYYFKAIKSIVNGGGLMQLYGYRQP